MSVKSKGMCHAYIAHYRTAVLGCVEMTGNREAARKFGVDGSYACYWLSMINNLWLVSLFFVSCFMVTCFLCVGNSLFYVSFIKRTKSEN
jgi:hypothetical protein